MLQFLHINCIKATMILLVLGLVTVGDGVSPTSADIIIDTPQPHIISGGITPTNPLSDVYLVANYVSATPGVYDQVAFLIGDTVPADQETTFEFIIPDLDDYFATRYYTVMGIVGTEDVNLGFTPSVAADLITNGTSWDGYFNESFQPDETSVANWLRTGNSNELGGFLNGNSGISPHKFGVGIDTYGDTVQYNMVDFCYADDGGDTWISENPIPEPITMLLLAPGMFFIARRRRQK